MPAVLKHQDLCVHIFYTEFKKQIDHKNLLFKNGEKKSVWLRGGCSYEENSELLLLPLMYLRLGIHVSL